MTCEELREMYELYALGALEGEELAELDAHLERGCEACRRGIKRALATNAMIASFAPPVEPPARLRRKVLASLGMEKPGWIWTGAWAAVTAGLLIAVLWFGGEARRHQSALADARRELQRTSEDLARVQQALQFLDQPDTKQVGFGKGQPAPPRGNVFVNQNGVLLIASNLPQVQAGKKFEMWIIPKAKGSAPVPAGMFQADARGLALHLLAGQIDVATLGAVAVTIEPEAGSAAPTSTPIIVAPVAG